MCYEKGEYRRKMLGGIKRNRPTGETKGNVGSY